jgi:hypothetical protein
VGTDHTWIVARTQLESYAHVTGERPPFLFPSRRSLPQTKKKRYVFAGIAVLILTATTLFSFYWWPRQTTPEGALQIGSLDFVPLQGAALPTIDIVFPVKNNSAQVVHFRIGRSLIDVASGKAKLDPSPSATNVILQPGASEEWNIGRIEMNRIPKGLLPLTFQYDVRYGPAKNNYQRRMTARRVCEVDFSISPSNGVCKAYDVIDEEF